MSTKSDRIYRPVEPSDLPRIQAGRLKAFYRNDKQISAQFLTTQYSSHGETVFLAIGKDYDFLLRIHEVVVDVTPEKRYAVWSHNIQRFIYTNNDQGFLSKAAAELHINNPRSCYVVEWEIRKDD